MPSRRARNFYELEGVIASSGFSSGHRVVIGVWGKGPLGAMVDVMMAEPSGRRILIAPNERVARFVSAIYRFEEVRVVDDLIAEVDKDSITVTSNTLNVQMNVGWSIPIPLRRIRTPLITRYIESPIARRLMNVQTFGVTSNGISEWYRADRYRRVATATAAYDGVDLGTMSPLQPPLGVGFSEPPLKPSIVHVRPLLHDPSAQLRSLAD